MTGAASLTEREWISKNKINNYSRLIGMTFVDNMIINMLGDDH